MADEIRVEEWLPGRRLWLKTPGLSSTDVALEILRWMQGLGRCSIEGSGSATANYGKLAEPGVAIRIDDIKVWMMCSYDDLFIGRLAGHKRKFAALCEAIQQTFATPSHEPADVNPPGTEDPAE